MKRAKSTTKTTSAKATTKTGNQDVKPAASSKKLATKSDKAKAASAAKSTKASAVSKAGTSKKSAAKASPTASVQLPSAPTVDKEVSNVAPPIEISSEEISIRAYYIAERRQKMGWPGDPCSDWLEAERQLREEAARAAKLLQ